MKKKIKLTAVLIVLLTISGPIWAQAGKNQVTYTIDGGDFHHQQVTIKSDPKAMENGAWTSTGGSSYLKINLDDATPNSKTGPDWGLDIAFNHVGTGTAKVNEPINSNTHFSDKRVYFLLQVQVNGQTNYLMSSSKKPDQTPGTITITRLGPVGGTVEGNFEGTLKDAGITYTITGGHFVATRKDRFHL